MKARIQITRSHIAFILLSVLTIFWISFIFGNSTLNREESTAQSDVVVEYISPIVDPHDQMSDGQITRMVRKGAHHRTQIGIINFAAFNIHIHPSVL